MSDVRLRYDVVFEDTEVSDEEIHGCRTDTDVPVLFLFLLLSFNYYNGIRSVIFGPRDTESQRGTRCFSETNR